MTEKISNRGSVTRSFSSKSAIDGLNFLFISVAAKLDNLSSSSGHVAELQAVNLADSDHELITINDEIDLASLHLNGEFIVDKEIFEKFGLDQESIRMVAKVFDNSATWAKAQEISEFYLDEQTMQFQIDLADFFKRKGVLNATVTVDFLYGAKPSGYSGDWVSGKKFSGFEFEIKNKNEISDFKFDWDDPDSFEHPSQLFRISYTDLDEPLSSVSVTLNKAFEIEIGESLHKLDYLIVSEFLASVLDQEDFGVDKTYEKGSIGRQIIGLLKNMELTDSFVKNKEFLKDRHSSPFVISSFFLGDKGVKGLLK